MRVLSSIAFLPSFPSCCRLPLGYFTQPGLLYFQASYLLDHLHRHSRFESIREILGVTTTDLASLQALAESSATRASATYGQRNANHRRIAPLASRDSSSLSGERPSIAEPY